MSGRSKSETILAFVRHKRATKIVLGLRRVPVPILMLIAKTIRGGKYCESIKVSRLNLDRLETTQTQLLPMNWAFAICNYDAIQSWPSSEIPVIVRFKSHQIIWNGHHRAMASVLLKRPLRYREYRIGKP